MAGEPSPIRSLGLVLMQTFLVILLGASVVRLGMLRAEDGRVIGFITGRLALPLLIFKAVATAEVLAVDFRVVGVLVAVKLFVQLLTMVGAALLAKGGPGQALLNAGIYGLYTTSSADFPIGFPVVMALFQKSTMDDFCAYLTMLAVAQDLCGNTVALVSLEAGRAQQTAAASATARPRKRSLMMSVVKNIAGNQLLWMVVGGLVFRVALGWTLVRKSGKLQLPTGLGEAIEVLTSPFRFLVLFQVGLSVGALNSGLLFQDPLRYLGMVLLNLTKLVLLPLLMVAALLLSWSDSLERRNKFLTFTLIYGALPSPAAIVAFARLYGLNTDVVGLAVPMGLALSGPILWGVATLGHLYMHSTDHIWEGDPVMERYLQHPGLVSGIAVLLLFLCGGREWRRFPVVIFGHFAVILIAWHSTKLWLLRLGCRAPWAVHYLFHFLNYQVRLFGVSALWLVWGGLRGVSAWHLKCLYITVVFAVPVPLAIPAVLGPEMYDRPFWIMSCLYVGALVQRTLDFFACTLAWLTLLLGCVLFALAGGFHGSQGERPTSLGSHRPGHGQGQSPGQGQQDWEDRESQPTLPVGVVQGDPRPAVGSRLRQRPTLQARTRARARACLGSLTDLEPEEEPPGDWDRDLEREAAASRQQNHQGSGTGTGTAAAAAAAEPAPLGVGRGAIPVGRDHTKREHSNPSGTGPRRHQAAEPWGRALRYRMFLLPALAMSLYAGLQLPLDAALALLRSEMSSAWRAAISTGAAVVHCTQSAALLLLFLWSEPACELYRVTLSRLLAWWRLHSTCETSPHSESEDSSSEELEGEEVSMTEGSSSNGPVD